MSEQCIACWMLTGVGWAGSSAWGVLTTYGNGECVKFISMKAWGLLVVYQGFYLEYEGYSDFACCSIMLI